MSNILIVIPCYNEEKNIANVVSELQNDFKVTDILVVNDGSKDNSLAVIKQLNVNYLSLPYNLGYSAALQAGFKYAVHHEYEYVIQFDGDGQHIASEARRLFEIALSSHADIVIGSRFRIKTGYKHGLFKSIGTTIFRFLIVLLTKNSISDPTSGFQVLSRSVFEHYSKIYNYPEYPDANLLIEMLLEGFVVTEVPVEMRLREHGESMHRGIFRPIKYMVRMFYSIGMILINFAFTKKIQRQTPTGAMRDLRKGHS